MKFIFTLLFLLLSFNSVGQNRKIDDLLAKADSAVNNNLKLSAELSREALKIAQEINDSLYLSKCFSTLARCYSMQGAFDASFEKYHKAYDFCPHNQIALKASIGLKFSRFFMLTKNTDKALEYTQKSFEIYQNINDSAGIADCYNFRGMTYVNMDENELGEKDFYSAIELNKALGRTDALMGNYNNLAIYKSDNPKEKIELLHLAIKYNQDNYDLWSLAENYNNLGVQYHYDGQNTKALQSLLKAKEYALELDAKELICDNFRYLAWVYTELKQYKLANESFQAMYDIEHSIITERVLTEKEMTSMATQIANYEQLSIDERKIHSLEVQARNAIIVIVILVIALLAFIFATFIVRYKRKMRKLDAEIEAQTIENLEFEQNLQTRKRELVALSFHIRARMDVVDKLKEMVKDCAKVDVDDVKQAIKRVLLFINNQQAKDKEIDILTKEVEAICGEFLEKLKIMHPELTRNELQLAAFLRINMSSKEISMLTGTSEKSVNMARYRLRKHLNINNDVNLQDYVKNVVL